MPSRGSTFRWANVLNICKPYVISNFDEKYTKIQIPVIEHGESLDGPHEQLVARQLAPQAGEPGELAGAVALELLVQDLGGAEAVVVLDGPLQRRLGEGLVGVALVAVEQDLVEQGDVVDVLEDDSHDVGADLACRGLQRICVLALISVSNISAGSYLFCSPK